MPMPVRLPKSLDDLDTGQAAPGQPTYSPVDVQKHLGDVKDFVSKSGMAEFEAAVKKIGQDLQTAVNPREKDALDAAFKSLIGRLQEVSDAYGRDGKAPLDFLAKMRAGVEKQLAETKGKAADAKDEDRRRAMGITTDKDGWTLQSETPEQKLERQNGLRELDEEFKRLTKRLKEVDSEYAKQKAENDKAKGKLTDDLVGRVGGAGAQKAVGGVQDAVSGVGGLAGKANAFLAVADGAAQMVRGVIQGFGEAMKTAADVGKRLASNDGFGAIEAAGDGVAKALDKIPIVGGIAADALRTFTSGLNLAKSVLDSFADRGRELAKYNGALAGEVAKAQVDQILADIKESNQNQKLYVELIRAQSQIDREWQKAIVELKAVLAPHIIAMAKDFANVAKLLSGAFGTGGDTPQEKQLAAMERLLALLELWMGRDHEETKKFRAILEDIRKQLAPKQEGFGAAGLINLGRNGLPVDEKPAERQRGKPPLPAIFGQP